MDLENSRDELLYELHRQPTQSKTNLLTIRTYFKEVNPLTAKMKSGFMPEGRRKKWRERAFATMENQCKSYIEVFLSQPDQSGSDAAWLVHQLELAKSQIMGDLKVAKTILPSCCPPSYDIFNVFANWYASSLSASFRQIMKRNLQNAEIIPLLSWLKAYKSEEMMGNSDFKMEPDAIAELLEPSEIKALIQNYETNIRSKLNDWMTNCLTKEKDDWNSDKRPESDGNQQYFTSLPVILHDMIEENVKLAISVSKDLMVAILKIATEQLSSFLDAYKSAFQAYKLRHFGNRQEFMPYTIYTMAIINNLGSIMSNIQGTMSRYGEDVADVDKSDLSELTSALSRKLETLIEETISDLLDEMFMDLEGPFSKVMTRNWINSSESIDTICVTVEDYTQDYVHLKPAYFDQLVSKSRRRCITNYLRRLLSRSITFSNHEERLELANQIVKENDTIRFLYEKMGAKKTEADEEMSDAIPFVAEILRLTDPLMMSLELGTLVNNFPDVTKEHLMAILYLRSDVKGSASEIISECLGEDDDRRQKTKDHAPTVFSTIKIEPRLFQ